jgi:translation initiation factor IF-2
MTESKNTGDKTISVAPRKPLSLKRSGVERDTVRQSFSHGRTNTVQVERKKRRVSPPAETKPEPVAPARVAPQASARPIAEEAPPPPGSAAARAGLVLRQLSEDELDARARALADAKIHEAEERKAAEGVAERRAAEAARLAREQEEAERRKSEEEARRRTEEALRERAEDTARRRFGDEPAKPAVAPEETTARPVGAKALRETEADEEERPGVRGRAKTSRPAEPKPVRRAPEDRRRGRLTLVNALDDTERERSLASIRRRRERERARAHEGPREKIMREVVVPETITIQELANRMSERAVEVIKMLMKQGQLLKAADVIDADMAQLIAEEMGHSVRRVAESDIEVGLFSTTEDDDALEPRAPVVTIMGHVDHGKTSLLDAIRKANVVAGEAGGITQHIGAYQVEQDGHKITFIDTPGHAAFSAMRARGAKVTDIVILVVAADDSVMPQTIEAINHAKAANVPIIVAINKIDKAGANPQNVRNALLQHEVFVESMGGEVLDVEVSALNGTNLDKLLEAVLLQAEILELKANPNRAAEGTVIEAKLDRGRGAVATVLVEQGTLHVGDILIAGAEWGRVRALLDDLGAAVAEAIPSMPVEVLGFQGAPEAGDRFAVVESEARAREVADYRHRQKREKAQARMTGARGSLEQMMSQLQTAGAKSFPLIIKADVQGSVEAITGALEALGTDEVAARIIHSGVGGITESDVTLAASSGAAIIGFNVRANAQARQAAEQDGTEIRYYNVIYNLVDDVKAAMSGMLSPERRETMLGNAEVLEVFNISKVGKIAGCRVTDGVVQRGAGVRLIRDDVVVHEGKLSTLKRFKDEVREVPSGQECGMAFESYEDMRVGDVIECYRVEEIARTL